MSTHTGKLRVTVNNNGRDGVFQCPRCASTGDYSFKRKAGWCDNCSTVFTQDAMSNGLSLASANDDNEEQSQSPRWIRVQIQPAEIF
jgi:ribosomal protein L37AE/L43A